jgi:pyruvate-formate lyase-activating enzyme
MSPEDIVRISKDYAKKNWDNLYKEPKNRVTSWHAHELCHSCGTCITQGKRSRYCPQKLRLDQITLLDDLTWGPARNIISFTGGDLACQPEFYAQAARGIKDLNLDLWILFETNGYGLTANNLKTFDESGVDSFWLDIKAFDDKIHRRLTGSSNQQVLDLPAKITDKGFMLEVSSVYIPGWVEKDQIESIAQILANVDSSIPYAIIAFFPENKLKNVSSPNYNQMLEAFNVSKKAGLENVKLGNLGRFVKNIGEYEQLFKIGAI